MGLGEVHKTKKEAEASARFWRKDFLKRKILGRRVVIKPVPEVRLKTMIRPSYWKKMTKKDKKQYGVYFLNK